MDQTDTDDAGYQPLRAEMIELLQVATVIEILVILAIGAVDLDTRQPALVLVVLPLIAAAGARRFDRLGMTVVATTIVVALALAIVAAILVYPASQWFFAFPLVTILASVLLGDLPALGVAAVTSAVLLAIGSSRTGDPPVGPVGTALFINICAAGLSWIAAHPVRAALAWAWQSYLLAEQRTDELRDRQAELSRVAKSLQEACVRLEDMNAELERAQRAADEARQLKSEFAATISHELRTPLNLIIGFSEMMMSTPVAYAGQRLPESYRRDLEAIHRNAGQISRLIDDVLDLSQIDAQRMALERSTVSLRQIVAEATSTVALLFEQLGISLTVEVSSELPPLYVDATRIGQILINFLNNAARFTDRGGVVVRGTANDREVVVAVSDSGVGIPPEDLPYVFEEFHQVGASGRRRGGSGLGLAVCKRFAEMHGGYVRAESQPGVGSTFYLALPLGTNILSAPVSLRRRARTTVRPTIAVLDRDADVARVLQRYLDGYRVVRAGTTREIEQLAASMPLRAVVFTDRNALEGWRDGTQADDRLHNLPLVSCEIRTPRAQSDELGVFDYLTKPVTQERLISAIRRTGKRAREILVVEDDPEMSRLLASLIGAHSSRYRVRSAGTGAEALGLLRAKRPDLVLLDLLIPEPNGYEILSEIRRDEHLRDLPVVVVSAKGKHDETVGGGSLGISRTEGLTVGEMMKCLRSSLDALLSPSRIDNAPGQPAEIAEIRASGENRPRPAKEPEVVLAGSSRR